MADSDQEMTPAPTLEAEQHQQFIQDAEAEQHQSSSHDAEPEQGQESDEDAESEHSSGSDGSEDMDLVSSSPEPEAAQGRIADQPEAEHNSGSDRSASMDLVSSSPEAEAEQGQTSDQPEADSTAREQTPRPVQQNFTAGPEDTAISESEADPDRDYPEGALPGNTPPQDVQLNGHMDAPPMDHPLDPDFPIPSIESPDHSSRRSSVQTNGSVFDDSDPGRDTTVATTAPPQSPTPRPMPPRRPLVRIAPRPLRMPHNPEPLHLLYSGTSNTVPQRDVSSSLPSSESPPTSNRPFPPPPYPPGTNHQIPGLTLIAPVNSRSTPGGGQMNGNGNHQQQYPRGRGNNTSNGESSNGNQQQGAPFPVSQNQPEGNARQNQDNSVVHVTPRPLLDGQEVVRRLSQIAEDQEDSTSDGTTSPGYVLAQNPMEGSSANGLPENNAHQNGAPNAQPDMPIDPALGAPEVQQPPRANGQHNRAVSRGRQSRFIEHLDENPRWDGRQTDPPHNSAAPSRQASLAEDEDSEEEL
ncbi:hypothetical protein NW752_003135 [Fusarium irregulare]|uniref:Uncharacterized protein n=1 Tax=Fusarium irregulare TaxID=2494466 RepID=A0A9W8Q137_9HYPO|nr:hypothetical protein NW766_000805 [Fusarium irregulare]KAJ4025661.1 hypothetical protein NW752_003135 [Fusarium irregulare]